MITIKHLLIVPLSFMLLSAAAHAESIQLADGSVIDGELAPPAEVVVRTAEGERRVPFALLPANVQRVYWAREIPQTAQISAAAVRSADEEIAALAQEVNLATWSQVAAIGSFRDRPEKRGVGGLVVTKSFNALDENWVSVYSPKDPVGAAGHWNEQVARAKALQERTPQFLHQRWLELFIKAGEAVARRDSNEFAVNLREMKRSHITAGLESPKNFFTAK